MRKNSLFILIFILGFLGSCTKDSTSGNLYTPSSSDVTANATLAELQQGRTLYANNCGSCHNLYSPDDYSVNSWKSLIPNMASRTGLSASQVTLVTKYLCKGKQ